MRAIRQHVLPRFLLKGFASRTEGKEIYTWVYRNEVKPFEANITKVGVEKYFYGRKGELSVDDDITEFEGKYAPLIDELRVIEGKAEISDERIPDLITHLVTRTKHLRDSFRGSFELLTAFIGKYLSNFDNLKPLILRHPNFINKIKEKIRNYPAPRHVRRRLQKFIQKNISLFLETQREEMENIVRELSEDLISSLPSLMKESHIKELSQRLIPEPRLERYCPLKWFINNCDTSIILGDIGCMFETIGSKRYKPLDFSNDEIINVFLPIGKNKMLIGTSLSSYPQIDFSLINENIAKCCRDFFICSKNNHDIESLALFIGEEAELWTKEEIEQIVNKIFEEKLSE